MKIFTIIINTAFGIIFFITASSNSQSWNFAGGVSPSIGSYPSLSVYSSNSIIAAGGSTGVPYIARSTNGGANFTEIGHSGILYELYCIWAVDDNTIYAGDGGSAGGNGGNAHVYKTTNGGASWSVIFSTGGNSGFINGIVFSRTNPLVGIIESDPPVANGNYWMQKTTNGGATWVLQQPPGSPNLITSQNSVVVTDENHYGFGTGQLTNSGDSYVKFTTNGGINWQSTDVSTAPYCAAFAMSSNWVNGISASSTPTSFPIARTTNGFSSFTNITGAPGIEGIPTAKWVYGTQHVYLGSTVSAGSFIEQSTDGGLTWSLMNTNTTSGITHMDLVYDSISSTVHAYAICSDQSILQMVTDLIGIDPNNTTIPKNYILEQNYPNPFNPSTNIKYSLPRNSHVILKIYDMLGHEVRTIVNSYQNTGNYIEPVDISDLASGIYIYKLYAQSVSGQIFSDAKKMSLIK